MKLQELLLGLCSAIIGLCIVAALAYGGHLPESGAECVFAYTGARVVDCGAQGPVCAEIPMEISYQTYMEMVDKVADRCGMKYAGRGWEWSDGSMVKPFYYEQKGVITVFSIREHKAMAVPIIVKR